MDGKKLSERQKKVLALIEEQGSVSTERLCEYLSISESTARRVLMTLEGKKYIRRFRGGAMILRSNRPEPPVLRRSQESHAEKEAIARRALQYIHEGDTILLSAGSTVLELCPLLKDFQHLMTDDFSHLPQYRSFRECADRTVAMAHHQKLYQDGLATLLRFQEVDALLIDSGLPQSLAGDLREAGCNLELCGPSYASAPPPEQAK